MSNLFDAQTKDVIESRMAQTLHTITEKEQSTMEGTFAVSYTHLTLPTICSV